MAVGDVVQVAFSEAIDEVAGYRVTRLTEEGVRSWYPYFTQPLFDEAGRLLLNSDRSGELQLYLLDVTDGRLRQLTDHPGGIGGHQATILPTRNAAAYIAANAVWRVDLDQPCPEKLADLPDGYGGSILAPDAHGAHVTFAVCEKLQTITATGWQYSDFHERLYRRPSSLILRVMTDDGQTSVIWGEREWISHVIVSPTDADAVVYCHEGPWDRVQRLWLLRASNGRVEPLLAGPAGQVRAGHEFFCADGRLAVQYATRLTPTARDWVHYDAVTDLHQTDRRFYRYPDRMPTHIQASWRDPSLFCGDAADIGDGDPAVRSRIGLIRHTEDERCRVTPLCAHNTSWQDQPSHPHPVFSPDDQCIYFNSDQTGQAAVYRVPVPR